MTAEQLEYPAPPWVELYAPTPTPEERRVLQAANASNDPEEVWRHALTAHRLLVIEEVRRRLSPEKILTDSILRDTLDTIWQITFPVLHQVTGPMVAEAYIRGFREANAGDVPIKMVYALAEEHVRRTGQYFHGTSSDALIQGFNTYVNRRVPERVALTRVLDAYGLSPRQMSGLTSAKQFDTKVESSAPQMLKQKLKNYISRSIGKRLKIFAHQEAHNLNEQAQQVAWMWMVEHGKLPRTAEKMWITAKDERVCGICGPLHRTKVPVSERFILEDGQKLYVPGAHTNCRCTVRLQIPVLELVGKAERFDPREHPRGTEGRFVRVPPGPEVLTDSRFIDPRLEQMFRQASELEEEEREQAHEIIESIPTQITAQPYAPIQPTGQIKATGGQIKAPGGQIKARSGQIRPVAPSSIQRPIAAQREQSGIQLQLPTQGQIHAAVEQQISHALVRQEPPMQRRHILRQGVQFKDANGDPLRVYTVADDLSQMFSMDGERVFIDESTDLEPLQVGSPALQAKIMEQFNQNIYNKTIDILEEARNRGTGYIEYDPQSEVPYGQIEIPYWGDNPAYQSLHAVLNDEEVSEVVQAYAHRYEAFTRDSRMVVEWFDDGGQYVSTTREFVADVALLPEFNLTPEDVEVKVITLDEGHEDTWDMQPGSRYGEETWRAPGVYKIDSEHRPDDPNYGAIPLKFVHVVPEIEEIVFDLPHDRQADWPKNG